MFTVVERSIASLLKDIVGNLQQIVRAEVRLAKAEVTAELGKARRAMVLIAIGGLFAVMTLGFLLLGAVYALAQVVQPWAAAILVAGGAAIVGGVSATVGASRLKLVSLPPPRTVSSVQENIQWAKAQAR